MVVILRYPDTKDVARQPQASYEVAADLSALMALASGRRIELAAEFPVRVQGDPRVAFLGYGKITDRSLHGPLPESTWDSLENLLRRVSTLSDEDAEILGSAIGLHSGAIVLSESDPRSAYILLVAGLEVLSRAYGEPPTGWSDWEESSAWDKCFEKTGLNSANANIIRRRLLRNKQLRLKATFRSYVVDKLTEDFWDQPLQDWEYPVVLKLNKWGDPSLTERSMIDVLPRDMSLLDRSLSKAYDLRSGLVHRGHGLHVFDTALPAGRVLTNTEPLPFALLRAILVNLTRRELFSRSDVGELPDIRVSFRTTE